MADGMGVQGMDFRKMVNAKTGEVDRNIFSDQQIYQLELERIFARCWNFMCHESQIPKPGDFFLSFIGDDSVIATRDKKGTLQVLLNTCRHRGNAVCRAEQGHANSFLCTYHGWTYGLDGKLIGVPGFKDFYHEDLDRSQWGLIAAPKVQSYYGFVFASMDPDAPDLEDYLGPVGRMGLDQMAARGKVLHIDGVQKNIIGCNWKLAVDNLFDWYHPQISHASAFQVGTLMPRRVPGATPPTPADIARRRVEQEQSHRVVLGEYGHAIGGPRVPDDVHALLNENPDADTSGRTLQDIGWRYRGASKEQFGPVGTQTVGHPNIFPNLWLTAGGTQLSLRLPRGPNATEIWWFTLIDPTLPQDEQRFMIDRANHVFGPAGMLEQDDGENWDQSTRATRSTIAKRYPLNFSMNLGRGQIKQDNTGAAYIDTHISEHAQLWTYVAWADWMSASTWQDLRSHHTPVPQEAF